MAVWSHAIPETLHHSNRNYKNLMSEGIFENSREEKRLLSLNALDETTLPKCMKIVIMGDDDYLFFLSLKKRFLSDHRGDELDAET